MRDRQPNRLLAWERLQRGWSYEEMAERIRAEMARCGEVETGLTANTVRRWETGERRPDPRYRKHLVGIMGKPASELGLLTPDELRMRPEPAPSAEFDRVWAALGRDTPDETLRRSLLHGLATAGTLPLLTPLLSLESGDGGGPAKPTDPDAYVTVTEGHRRLYWTTPARLLYEAVYAHTQLGIELLRGASGQTRVRLASALAESALLTARLALFDLRNGAVAERSLELAFAATRESGDHALAAVVRGHMAFRLIFGPAPGDAREILAAARQHTWHGVSPVVRSWLHCVASEAEARAGDAATGHHQIDLARKAIESDDAPHPEWLDFYSPARMQSFAGYAALSAGDHDDAAACLTGALTALTGRHGNERSASLAALARAHGDDADRAASLLVQAVDALATDWYRTGYDRVRAVRPMLRDSRVAAEVDERLDALGATTPEMVLCGR